MNFSVLALAALFASCAGSYEDPLPKEAIRHRVKTHDGWELSLVEYKSPNPTGRPVLLCHGISANARNLDLDADHSLARWVAAHGRDAWALSLRGTGDSDAVDLEKGRKNFDFDTLWREDLAAAVSYVREQEHADSVDYIGHSMGGMLVYAYLAEGGAGLNAVVTMGSPARLDWGPMFEPLLASLTKLSAVKEGVVPVVSLGALSVPLQGELESDPVMIVMYNPKNTDKQTWKRLVAISTANISGALGVQMVHYISTGHFDSADEKLDFRKDLGRVHTPVMVIAGKADRLAIVPAVKEGYRALGGEKEWLLLSEELGNVEADYGHMDLVAGTRAGKEVWSHALDFLNRHPGH